MAQLEPLHGEEERRVIVRAGPRPGRQGHAHGEHEHAERQQRLDAPKRPAVRRLDAKGDERERQEVEEVALLHELRLTPDRRLEEQQRAEEGGQPAERRLCA